LIDMADADAAFAADPDQRAPGPGDHRMPCPISRDAVDF
jgi:hypothetical protein